MCWKATLFNFNPRNILQKFYPPRENTFHSLWFLTLRFHKLLREGVFCHFFFMAGKLSVEQLLFFSMENRKWVFNYLLYIEKQKLLQLKILYCTLGRKISVQIPTKLKTKQLLGRKISVQIPTKLKTKQLLWITW